jgi:hypothetical protein
MESKYVIVGVYENEFDAEVAKGHLESVGIESFIIKDDSGVFPSFNERKGIRLEVSISDEEEAKAILEDMSNNDSSDDVNE